GQYSPGLPHFPKEGGDHGILNGPNWSQYPNAGLPPGDEVPPEWTGAAAAWGALPPASANEETDSQENDTTPPSLEGRGPGG
ncbi:MAG: hypothetical protein ACRDJE_18465, partial [Dehalococcoidia bacterium]